MYKTQRMERLSVRSPCAGMGQLKSTSQVYLWTEKKKKAKCGFAIYYNFFLKQKLISFL